MIYRQLCFDVSLKCFHFRSKKAYAYGFVAGKPVFSGWNELFIAPRKIISFLNALYDDKWELSAKSVYEYEERTLLSSILIYIFIEKLFWLAAKVT